MKYDVGDRITWEAVNGPKSGFISEETPLGYMVLLDNGKCVIVHENSIKAKL